MAKEKYWNIWRIRNRFLRAVFTLVCMTPLLVAAGAVLAIVAICAGIGEGAAYAWHVAKKNSDVKNIWSGYWRAISFKEAA